MSDYRQVPHPVSPSRKFGYFDRSPEVPIPPTPRTPPGPPVPPFAREPLSPPWPTTRSELRRRKQEVTASLQKQIEVEMERERERKRLMDDYVVVQNNSDSSLIAPADLSPLEPSNRFNFFPTDNDEERSRASLMNRISTQDSLSPSRATIASFTPPPLTEATNLMVNASLLGQTNSSRTPRGLSPFPEPVRGSIDPSVRTSDVKINRKPVNYDLASNVPKPFPGDASKSGTYTCDASPPSGSPKPDNSEAAIDCSDKSAFSSLLISVLNFRKDAEKMLWCTAELEGRIRNCAYAGKGWELRPVMSRQNGKTVPEESDVDEYIRTKQDIDMLSLEELSAWLELYGIEGFEQEGERRADRRRLWAFLVCDTFTDECLFRH
ncbi:hypothetical protein C343_05370 [Cryptococcus neoformans C23]|uniref:Uncharacterized protein n=1 Tax=Cryptococcus neoformans (strain H99 / ATCC 208821 / CBS 10515 / FGSC 9487) TaxID=235443 RepID=J9VSI1_CRYN9|nr:hypothetical protein CNAG_04509 [Cryptococcus neoformans var. grubii H99]AUB27222.1 hypothetical protein CKF44_04509 [Cryptococcus neoformans var. grubii]OWZ28935.1 hypothetical protein C347_05417 [Cryptococcus neoformans var. grubii AD2-60a]OWZ35110.1 hypothetical protein C353_05267 [Cryptococcus neoformans var. grubii AD1-83a]OWZ40885.1 hypothetical protein C343_05370 [Cryptococcus neoformans var. grubii C23]OWZ51859.1 hypothetical protein C368_05529 [Cryptococcus neoformans var. grubii 1|eukprot:XP_012051562.1 hypothetical protein CNAG_04509 [Cryptococcus neoformans var. grubii H99]